MKIASILLIIALEASFIICCFQSFTIQGILMHYRTTHMWLKPYNECIVKFLPIPTSFYYVLNNLLAKWKFIKLQWMSFFSDFYIILLSKSLKEVLEFLDVVDCYYFNFISSLWYVFTEIQLKVFFYNCL